MFPTKVCLQCKTAVPVRRKTCERCDHVFRSKWKAECNLRKKAVLNVSDSVQSAKKAKDKLHKDCERVSETREQTLHRQEQNRMHMVHKRVTVQWLIPVNTQVQSHALLCQGFGTSVPFICMELMCTSNDNVCSIPSPGVQLQFLTQSQHQALHGSPLNEIHIQAVAAQYGFWWSCSNMKAIIINVYTVVEMYSLL